MYQHKKCRKKTIPEAEEQNKDLAAVLVYMKQLIKTLQE
jgi:hypothetical protein